MLDKKNYDLASWLNFIESIDPSKIELGLDRVLLVLKRLNLDFTNTRVIEVAGTNGKGSTAALISKALVNSGFSVGLYTSPHLFCFNERVVINDKIIDDKLLCEAFYAVDEAKKEVHLTYFEYTTLAALYAFCRTKVDVMVLEIGLGGRLDAVNVIDADLCVIASIGLDHMAILGNTIAKIAYEKAGIIKENSKVIVGNLSSEAFEVINEVVTKKHATLYDGRADNLEFSSEDKNWGFNSYFKNNSFIFENKPYHLPKVPRFCAILALKALEVLESIDSRFKVSLDAKNKALDTTALLGRMQKVHESPDVYLDVAHNEPAAVHLCQNLSARAINGKRIAVVGMLKDKDIESVLSVVKDSFDAFYVSSLGTVRGEKASRLYNYLHDTLHKKEVFSFEDVKSALISAYNKARCDDEIVVFGSFVTVSDASLCLKDIF